MGKTQQETRTIIILNLAFIAHSPRHLLQNLIIVFTRFPTPGNTKTRLSPALGAKGAAELQRRMTEHAVQQSINCSQETACAIEICHHGGSSKEMNDWLGDLQFYPQTEQSLGQNMQHAFARGFAQKYRKILLIGTDCPELSCGVMVKAFTALTNHDLTLAPTYDGGYCLIGLKQKKDFLFQAINWGTNCVMSQTMHRAKQKNLSIHTLEYQHDIDLPEDLKYFHNNPGFK